MINFLILWPKQYFFQVLIVYLLITVWVNASTSFSQPLLCLLFAGKHLHIFAITKLIFTYLLHIVWLLSDNVTLCSASFQWISPICLIINKAATCIRQTVSRPSSHLCVPNNTEEVFNSVYFWAFFRNKATSESRTGLY